MNKSNEIQKLEDERLKLLRSGGSGGTVLFWLGGVSLGLVLLEAWFGEASFATGFGFATCIGVLIWAGIEHDKKAKTDRKIVYIENLLKSLREHG